MKECYITLIKSNMDVLVSGCCVWFVYPSSRLSGNIKDQRFWFWHFFFSHFKDVWSWCIGSLSSRIDGPAILDGLLVHQDLAFDLTFKTFTTVCPGCWMEQLSLRTFSSISELSGVTRQRGAASSSLPKQTNRRRQGRRFERELQIVSKATEKSSLLNRTWWHFCTDGRWKTLR